MPRWIREWGVRHLSTQCFIFGWTLPLSDSDIFFFILGWRYSQSNHKWERMMGHMQSHNKNVYNFMILKICSVCPKAGSFVGVDVVHGVDIVPWCFTWIVIFWKKFIRSRFIEGQKQYLVNDWIPSVWLCLEYADCHFKNEAREAFISCLEFLSRFATIWYTLLTLRF